MSAQTSLPVGAVFGLGRAGRIHFGNIASLRLARVKYVIDADPKAASVAAAAILGGQTDELPKFLLPEEEDQAMADPEVTFCVICSPTMTHETALRKCINSGKQMFCEKPIATSLESMKEVYKLAENKGLLLHCSFNRRYDPSFSLLRDRIPTTCGEVHTIRTCSRDNPYPSIEYLRTSGGIFHDCGVHDLDMACWLAGEWPSTVFATAARHNPQLKDFNDHDTAVIVVHGAQGMIASNNVCDRAVTSSTAAGVNSANIQYSFPQRYAEGYVNSMRSFLSRISGSDENAMIVTPIESLNVSTLADACEKSLETGAPVKFQPINTL
uniref:GFO_IDH_MocA domain-containing protein n=1 Tax=Macrostomum lignano TaxID=282301 RepID=A0A1I8H6T9_9PLAT